jgi:hypothetical protein
MWTVTKFLKKTAFARFLYSEVFFKGYRKKSRHTTRNILTWGMETSTVVPKQSCEQYDEPNRAPDVFSGKTGPGCRQNLRAGGLRPGDISVLEMFLYAA